MFNFTLTENVVKQLTKNKLTYCPLHSKERSVHRCFNILGLNRHSKERSVHRCFNILGLNRHSKDRSVHRCFNILGLNRHNLPL